jgi:hypothetical protein
LQYLTKKTNKSKKPKQYEQRAVDVVNNFLDQQDAFAKQLASQPSEIIVGKIPGTVLAQVILTGDEETLKNLALATKICYVVRQHKGARSPQK